MQAELQYNKREKKIAPTGWEAFNQKALYEAYEKRTSNIPCSQEVWHTFTASACASRNLLLLFWQLAGIAQRDNHLRPILPCRYDLLIAFDVFPGV